MPPPSSESRTNSLAFAKTDCHTCTANRRQCDRKRPRCSSCSAKNIVCGGYPMQLTWSKSKPIQPMFLEPIDDPFYLEPLSLKASLHVRDRNRGSRPYKPRKFRFVAEQATGRKQTSPETGEAHIRRSSAYPGGKRARTSIQQSSIALDRSIYQCTSTPGSPLLGTLDDGVHGKM
jgi:hypothetical protein